MFRGVTRLKGLIFDLDSFEESVSAWEPFVNTYKCCFLTSMPEKKGFFQQAFPRMEVIEIPYYIKNLAPNQQVHGQALRSLQLQTSEVAYVSKEREFITRALGFMSGVIQISNAVPSYQEASQYPDLVTPSLKLLFEALESRYSGWYGEAVLSPLTIGEKKAGYVNWARFTCDGEEIPLFFLGRYYAGSHYMVQQHPYSSAIFLNKKEGGKAYGIFNSNFCKLYGDVINLMKEDFGIDSICNVPERPNKPKRFASLLQWLSKTYGLENLSDRFQCIRDYPSQKTLNEWERQRNVQNAFSFQGDLSGRKIALLEDVVTTGATVRECIRTLKQSGATKIFVVSLGINQLGGSYWRSDSPKVPCPVCGQGMRLLVNSSKRQFFYSCYNCRESDSYLHGRERMIQQVNQEFAFFQTDEDDQVF